MELPLYLYHSPLAQDFALLPSPPTNVTYASSYSLFDESPMTYVAGAMEDVLDGKGVEFKSYYSVSRQDIQTTTAQLNELNEHGGDYFLLGSAGYILSEPVTSSSTRYAPLALSYSNSREDAVTGPMNYADFNALLNDEDAFRSQSRILGWAAMGGGGNIALSETFPSAGGADCPASCGDGESSFNAIYRVGADDEMSSSPGGKNFLASMKLAGDVLKGIDDQLEPEAGTKVHVSFEYFCCQTADEKEVILDVLSSQEWEPQSITFDRVATRIDNPESDGSTIRHYSLCVFLDEESNEKMMSWVGQIEDAIEDRGVKLNSRRRQQEPYHSTLVVVDGRNFPVEDAMRKINNLVKPGTWTGGETLDLTKPDF
mmetsp:Transcript_21304/g.44370  ORF Transcript_21304/g.44370 Transcript_21304/m.44370 type:complete len:371 (-) Transcript_21304:24-1136(-)